MAFASTDARILRGSHDDPVIDGELMPLALQVLLEILKTKLEVVHKILKAIRLEPNLRLGGLPTRRADDPLLESLLIAAPLTTLWFFAFT
ncbi:hypothetical protein AMTR_s00054p00106550 [Amborella trichopoda]|uniref:Uncharacterized protein n=1 Tax=Amborella trichopoda TaxID=13333 RepID=U5D6S4_AMBTC|nr:hypothetical protein AMTR_s00054p00106550 [Amborella trichopoda]